MNTKPIRVTWTREDELRCALMASMGFSTRAIIRETGLTSSQTTYRLKKAGIKRADYRNGESYMAKFQLRHATTDPELIRRTLKLRIIRLKIEVRGFQK